MEVYTYEDGVYYLIGNCDVDPERLYGTRWVVPVCYGDDLGFEAISFKIEILSCARSILIADSIKDAGYLPGFVQYAMCPSKIKEQLGGIMRKLFLLLLVAFVPVILAVSKCSTNTANYYYDSAGQYVEITDPPAQCVIYRILGNTTAEKTGLFVANYAALKKGLYTAEDALNQLDFLQSEAESKTATVGSFISALVMVAGKVAKAGQPELILITQNLQSFINDTTPLDDCTRYKLIAYIGSQKTLAAAFAGGS